MMKLKLAGLITIALIVAACGGDPDPTPTPTPTSTDTPTATPTDTPTATPTDTPTSTATPSATATSTATATATVTITPTIDPANSNIQLTVESPANNSEVRTSVEIVGWVVDLGAGEGNGPGIAEVRVHHETCDGDLYAETDEFEARPGTAEDLGLDESYDRNGFRISLEDVPRGSIPLEVCARSILGDDIEASARVNVQMIRGVQLVMESPPDQATVGSDMVVRGWALDLDAPEGEGPGINGVFIMPGTNCDGEPYGDAPLDIERPDVQEMFDLDDSFLESGFEFVLESEAEEGNFNLSVCALSTITGELQQVRHRVTISQGIFLFVPEPNNNATLPSPVTFRGIAVDFKAGFENGPGIDVVQIFAGESCEGEVLGESELSVERPDVLISLALDESHLVSSFLFEVELPPGSQTVAVCAHSSVDDNFSDPRVIDLNVQ